MFQWLTQLFRSTRRDRVEGQAHMTFGQTSVGRSISRAGLLLKKQLWIWPIIAVVLLSGIGFGIRLAIERTMKASLSSQLQTLLGVERSMIETWLKVQESNAESLANDQQIRELAAQLLAAAQPALEDSLVTADSQNPAASVAVLNARLARELGPGMSSHDFVSYFVANKQQVILASS